MWPAERKVSPQLWSGGNQGASRAQRSSYERQLQISPGPWEQAQSGLRWVPFPSSSLPSSLELSKCFSSWEKADYYLRLSSKNEPVVTGHAEILSIVSYLVTFIGDKLICIWIIAYILFVFSIVISFWILLIPSWTFGTWQSSNVFFSYIYCPFCNLLPNPLLRAW